MRLSSANHRLPQRVSATEVQQKGPQQVVDRLVSLRSPFSAPVSCASSRAVLREERQQDLPVLVHRAGFRVLHPQIRIRRPRRDNKLAPMGLYPALVVLGIYDRCTPKLASDASRAVAMHSSLAEAQAQLRSDGIALDIKTLRSTAYRYAARARAAQQSAACGLLDRVTGKRVVVSLDGGRVRVRRKKRGPKTKKGRNRFHTDWKEPKLLILYVVGDDGRPSQTWAPIRRGHAPGNRRRSSPCCCRTRGRAVSTPLTRCSSSPTARPGSGDASSASSLRSGSRRHRCWG